MGASRSARRADWLRARRTRRVFTPHIHNDPDDVSDLDWHDDVYPDAHDDVPGLHTEYRGGDHNHGGADINNYDDYDPVVLDDGTHKFNNDNYVLVRRDDYDNLVAALHFEYYNDRADYVDNLDHVARILVNHTVDDGLADRMP